MSKTVMEIWDEVTDPSWQKKTNNGRYTFTTIDPHHQLRRATELWGPYGEKWGIRNCNWTLWEAEPSASVLLEADFFYPSFEDGSEVSFEYAIDMKYIPGFDVCKRAMTSFRSKCLSQLGFNADVYEGKFDDPSYIEKAETIYRNHEAVLMQSKTAILAAKHLDALAEMSEGVVRALTSDPPLLTQEEGNELHNMIDERRALLQAE